MRPGRDWQALLRAPRLHGVRGARAASAFFVGRVLGFARAHPRAFLGLQAKKLRLLAAGNEIPRNQEIYPTRAYSPVLRALLWKVPGLAFPFGLLLPLGVVGLGVGARRAPMLAALVLALAAVVVAFFVTARYRAPLVPFLLVFAAEGVRWWGADASGRARAVAITAALPLLALANLGQGPMPARTNPDAEFGLGVWLEEEGRPDAAAAHYRTALAMDPSNWDAWHELGALLARQGRHAEAAVAFRRARAIVPRAFDTLTVLSDALARAGCFAGAADYARRALALEPGSGLAREILRRAEDGAARPAAARRRAACASLDLHPGEGAGADASH
jgi:tetratricopeptide (TPR) repeat protein